MDVFDTNVWVAIANANDSLHRDAMQELDRVQPPVLLPEYVIVETCNVLTRRAGKEFTDHFLDRISNNAEIQIFYAGKETLDHAMIFFRSAQHPGLSFVDSFLLYLSKVHHVVTFDKQLSKAIQRAR